MMISARRTPLAALILLTLYFANGDAGEMRIEATSGSYDPPPVPIEAFFNSELEIQFSISGSPDDLEGKTVIYALFQRIGERILPLGDTVRGGVVEHSDTGELHSKLVVPVPEFSGRTRLAVRAQIEGTDIGSVIDFAAVPDDILTGLAARKVRVTEADTVGNAFAQRDLNYTDQPLENVARTREWTGLWFVSGAWGAQSLPDHLRSGQLLILLKDDEETLPFPIATRIGEGWMVQFPLSWFDDFSTNAGTQAFFLKTISHISSK